MYYNVGSPSYMSPEAYKKCQYSNKSDVWALGVIFYEMLTGCTIDFNMEIKDYFGEIDRANCVRVSGFTNKTISKTSQMLLGLMLKLNPKERISPQELLKPIDFPII